MTATPQIWDISAPVHSASPAYPGDAPYQQRWTARIGADCPVNVSAISLSPHLGTHADAPLHYDASGPSMGAVDLQPYIGPCRVIHAIGCGPLIAWQHLQHAITPDLPPRVLVRTYAQAPQQWDEHLSGMTTDAIARLADHVQVRLLGQEADEALAKQFVIVHCQDARTRHGAVQDATRPEPLQDK